MERLEIRVNNLEEKINRLELRSEKNQELINQHTTNLATIVIELKNVTKSLETVTSNWKEAINRSNARQEEERANINKRISDLEKGVENLSSKLDERTILKDNKNYDDIKMKILIALITAVISFVLGFILK